jgi:hypothetical protein
VRFFRVRQKKKKKKKKSTVHTQRLERALVAGEQAAPADGVAALALEGL